MELAKGFWGLAKEFWELAKRFWELAKGSWELAKRFWGLAKRFWELAKGFWELAKRFWELAKGSLVFPEKCKTVPASRPKICFNFSLPRKIKKPVVKKSLISREATRAETFAIFAAVFCVIVTFTSKSWAAAETSEVER